MFPGPRTGPSASTPRMTVAEYHRMIEAGVFDTEEKERHELLDGWVVPKARQSPPHCSARGVLGGWVHKREPPAGWMYSQVASVVTPDSHPDPDGSFLRTAWMGKPCRYPRADEVAIVVEVADVSLAVDRTAKAAIYARAGIPEYWLIDLINRRFEVRCEPTAGGYCSRTVYLPGQSVPAVVGGTAVGAVPVSDVIR